MRQISSFLDIILIVGLVTAIPEDLLGDFKSVCRMSSNLYPSLEKILLKEESYEDCHHSVGFHFTTELCKQIDAIDSRAPKSMTAYLSEGMIVLFINIEDISEGSVYTLDLESAAHLPKRSDKTFTVVWIQRTPLLTTSPHIHKVKYIKTDNQWESLDANELKDSLRNEDQILLKDIKTVNNKQELNITFDGIQDIETKIKKSYLIVCLVNNYRKDSNCRPIQVHHKGISCECDVKNQLTTFLIFVAFWLLIAGITIKPVTNLLLDNEEKERTDFPMMISCNQRNAKYVYLIAIHLAKATPDFDLTEVNVDIEFFGKNESIAPVFRFKASLLEKQLVTIIRIHMWRLTRLPPLKKVQCSHSGRVDGRITLFGVYTQCRRDMGEHDRHGTDREDTYQINRNIGRESRFYPMTKLEEKDSDEVALETEKVERQNTQKTLSNFKINLSFLEKIWVLFVTISLIAFIASILHFSFESVFYEMLVKVLISSSVGIVFNYCFVKAYKWLVLAELKEQAKINRRYEKCLFVMIRILYIVSILGSIGIGVFIGFTRINQKDIETFKWLCVSFCATTLSVLVWNITSHISCTKGIPTTIPSEETISSVSASGSQ